MFEIIYIHHAELTESLLQEIINIKSVAWPYSIESQHAWIKANLKNNDIHVLLLKDNKVVAYLNLIEIELIIDSKIFIGFGIGNVCAAEKGKGWGKELINHVNMYLKKNNKVGLLFCKNNLVKFYYVNGWTLIRKDEFFPTTPISVNVMIFDLVQNYKQVAYLGNPF